MFYDGRAAFRPPSLFLTRDRTPTVSIGEHGGRGGGADGRGEVEGGAGGGGGGGVGGGVREQGANK